VISAALSPGKNLMTRKVVEPQMETRSETKVSVFHWDSAMGCGAGFGSTPRGNV